MSNVFSELCRALKDQKQGKCLVCEKPHDVDGLVCEACTEAYGVAQVALVTPTPPEPPPAPKPRVRIVRPARRL